MPSLEQLSEFARRTGYREEVLEKVIRLLELLADMNRHPDLSQALVLKGGTALHLGSGAPRRLSVDLDFNYVGSIDRHVMEQERPRLEGALARIVQALGYHAQWSRPAHAGGKCFLNYRNALGTPDRIEVDVNFLHRQLVLPITVRRLWSPDPDAGVTANLLSLHELCAGKICAMLDRMMPRDLYDVAHLPQIAPEVWSSALFRAILIALAGALPHPLYSYRRNRGQRFSDEQVRRQLHPTLMKGEAPDIGELLERGWALVEPFLDLEEREREFVDRIQLGELCPELLFPDRPELADRLRQHPVLLWKAQNAAAQRRRSRS